MGFECTKIVSTKSILIWKKNSSRGSYSHPKVIPTLILIEPTSTDERRSDLMWQSCCKNETCWSGLEFHYRGRRKKRVPIAFIIIVVEPISNGSVKFPFDAINAYAEKCPTSMMICGQHLALMWRRLIALRHRYLFKGSRFLIKKILYIWICL